MFGRLVSALFVCQAASARRRSGASQSDHLSLGPKTAVVYSTWRPTHSMLERMSEASCVLGPREIDVWILADTTWDPPDEAVSEAIARYPTCGNLRTFVTNETGVMALYPNATKYMGQLWHRSLRGKSFFMNHREMQLLQWRSVGPATDYDYVWSVEDDVGFERIADFIREQEAEPFDLLRPDNRMIREKLRDQAWGSRQSAFPVGRAYTITPPGWMHWSKRTDEFTNLFPTGFTPYMASEFLERYSRRALAVAQGMYARGEIAVSEMMLPTVCAYRDALPEQMQLHCANIDMKFKGAAAEWNSNVHLKTWQEVMEKSRTDVRKLPRYWHRLKKS